MDDLSFEFRVWVSGFEFLVSRGPRSRPILKSLIKLRSLLTPQNSKLETRNSELSFFYHQALAGKLPIDNLRAFLSVQGPLDLSFPSFRT